MIGPTLITRESVGADLVDDLPCVGLLPVNSVRSGADDVKCELATAPDEHGGGCTACSGDHKSTECHDGFGESHYSGNDFEEWENSHGIVIYVYT